jgi:membrane protein DedA with SNARE-associated domain
MTVDTISHLLLTYRYWILIPLAIIEGPALAIFVGIFVKLGYLSFIPGLIVMIFGDFIPDSLYYYIGRFGQDWKIFKKISKKLDDESLIINLWRNHAVKTLFMSKLAFGLAPALLATAGVAKVPYKFFVKYALIISIVQYSVFISVGYWIGYSYGFLQDVKYFGIFIASAVILFITIVTFAKKYARKKIHEMEKEQQ